MPSKREARNEVEVFELNLTHADIVDLMNDPDVLLDGGTVASDQEFEVAVRRFSGAETVVCCFKATDSLIVRFRKTTDTTDDTDFEDVDIS